MPLPGDDAPRPIPQGGRRPAVEHDGGHEGDAYVVDTRGGRSRVTPPPRRPQPSPNQPAVEYDDLGRPIRPRPVATEVEEVRGHPAPPTPRPPAPPRPRRRRARLVVSLLVLALLAYVAFTAYAPWNAWNGVRRVATEPGGTRPGAGDGSTYLLVGSDSREGLTAAQKKALGTGTFEGKRTDSILLVHVPSSGKSVVISLPRDSYVPIPGHGSNKINAAYAFGGPKLLIETIEGVTDLRIDGYVEIGFGGFASVVDALGGVEINVPFDMDDPKAHINLKKGLQTLNGPNALGFVRARYSDPRGDIGRADRQRQFLSAIVKKAATPSLVLVPWKWWDFTHSAVAAIIVGEDTSIMEAYSVVSTMRGMSKGETLSLVVPIASTNYQTSAGSSVKWDSARARALFAMLRDGTPIEKAPPGTDGKPSQQ